jgi:hypothetical protein
MSAGKGSRPRPVCGDTYRENHERIFRPHYEAEATKGEVVEGHKCLGEGSWKAIDYQEEGLRDQDP